MMTVHAKIGTMPMSIIWIKNRRKPPKPGAVIQYRSIPLVHGEKWKSGQIDEVKRVGYTLYYISKV